jgi:hypothetical protein
MRTGPRLTLETITQRDGKFFYQFRRTMDLRATPTRVPLGASSGWMYLLGSGRV